MTRSPATRPGTITHLDTDAGETRRTGDNSDADQQTAGWRHAVDFSHDDLRQREREIALLKEVSAAVSSQLHLEKLFELVVQRARALIHAETVLIPLIDEDQRHYTYRAACGQDTDDLIGHSQPLEIGGLGWNWKRGQHRKQDLVDQLSESEHSQWQTDSQSLLLVPLIGKQDFIGAITCINKVGGEFDERDLEILSVFASQVSIAIENATAYDKLEKAVFKAEHYQQELRELNSRLLTANQKLETLAHYDHLTGAPNRSLVHSRLQQALDTAQQDNQQVAVMIVDLDHFKEVNDTLGHHVGDELLKQVCYRMISVPDDRVTFGRLGGDEFAVVMPNATATEAQTLAHRLVSSLNEPFAVEDNNFSVSASIGIALYPEHGDSMATLLRCADVAMYVAKREKCDCFVYNSERDLHSIGRLALSGETKSAIINDEMCLYYQPKVDTESGDIIGVEALARWPQTLKEMTPPDAFIPIMEQSGLIRRFTSWVLDQAIGQQSRWRQRDIFITMSINLSMYNLRDPSFPRQVYDSLEKWDVPAESIVFELTESAVMGDHPQVYQVFNELSARGIRFSIDDFGTGYSSLTLLRKLNVSELKMDKSFISQILYNKDDEVIVKSTLDLGHNLGLEVVAEGVEDEATREKLKTMGCRVLQGYHVGRPLPADELFVS
ncbi:MAG: EAL domain-containing protein [Gammaproteobacteria bacterium]|nr:EAL domain-containing protein [Gammaproteobacteria bacterium]